MTEITIKNGFGVISGLYFRDDIVKKGSYLLSGGHMGEIKAVRRNCTVSIFARYFPLLHPIPYIIKINNEASPEEGVARASS